MSTSQSKTKSSLSLLLSSTKTLLATRFQLKSTSSTQPRPTHNPPPNVAVANSTLSQQNCGDVVNDSDMAPRSSEDSARRIASGKTNAPYESSARWLLSTQSLILKHLPEQMRADDGFMAMLNLAFTTVTSRTARRDNIKGQVRICEETLGRLREELSRSEQDLQSILETVANLRRAVEFPDDHDDGGGDAGTDEIRGDLMTQADGLLRFAALAQGRSESRPSLLSSDSSTSPNS